LLHTVPADGEVSGPKGPPWELRDGDIFQCMTASTSLAHVAATECSLCEQALAPIEVRCRHSNASRAALWLQQKHCAAARSLYSKGDITIEPAGRRLGCEASFRNGAALSIAGPLASFAESQKPERAAKREAEEDWAR
jgi:hypothetical protein